ncbi:hypothetical protein ACXYTJ_05055 [Gilvimarinus sp. F26214L]|uniref:hypothetical protein n=1 Tax=Gilvimarinus sp. DZF01 TaxID=3461371 RepID=UPI004045DC5E
MSSDSSFVSDIDLDDWVDEDGDDQELGMIQQLDSRRLVENKLDDLRLLRETSEYDFDF